MTGAVMTLPHSASAVQRGRDKKRTSEEVPHGKTLRMI